MFKAIFKEYAPVYILEYGKSRPNYYSAKIHWTIKYTTKSIILFGLLACSVTYLDLLLCLDFI